MPASLPFGRTFVSAPGDPPLTLEEKEAAHTQLREWEEQERDLDRERPRISSSLPPGPFKDFIIPLEGGPIVVVRWKAGG